MTKLSATRINAELKKRGPKPRKVADGQGLCLEVPPTGHGRYEYRIDGKEKRASLGALSGRFAAGSA